MLQAPGCAGLLHRSHVHTPIFPLALLRAELEQVREDGFNAIVLVIPWPGFQVIVEGPGGQPLYDPARFKR